MTEVFESLNRVIADRRVNPQEGSYTCYLFEKGLDKILKKMAEECGEAIIAAKNGVAEETVGEVADLFFHTLVMMNALDIPLEALNEELERRTQKIGNLKVMKNTDHNT